MHRKLPVVLGLAILFFFSGAARAQSWQATAGAQSQSKARQVLAFLPDEIWIHAGDSVTWTFASDDHHTVTFLTPTQPRPSYTAGCPGVTPDGSPFNNSTCVNSGLLGPGNTYTVTFPTPGNYRLFCLRHTNMTGIVHVLDPTQPLPHEQAFYDRQAADQRRDLLSDRDERFDFGRPSDSDWAAHAHNHHVTVATGELVSNPGGINSVSLMRFLSPQVTIHVGETVEWSSEDVNGHTITFGIDTLEPPDITPSTLPSASVFLDPDGFRHAILNSPSDVVHSGTIIQAPQERSGLPELPAGATRFRVTFNGPGTYPYVCAFHDGIGMKGEVIVLPNTTP
jgi:plastocyanin